MITMDWPTALAQVGGALAVALIVWAVVWGLTR